MSQQPDRTTVLAESQVVDPSSTSVISPLNETYTNAGASSLENSENDNANDEVTRLAKDSDDDDDDDVTASTPQTFLVECSTSGSSSNIMMKPNNNNHQHYQDVSVSSPNQPSRCRIVLTYLSCSILALFLTCISPNTNLWIQNTTDVDNDDDSDTLERDALTRLIVVSVGTLFTLWLVQGSDPGYLTADICSEVYQEDGMSLLGYDDNTANNDKDEEDENDDNVKDNDATDLSQNTSENSPPCPLDPKPIDMEAPSSSSSNITRRGNKKQTENVSSLMPTAQEEEEQQNLRNTLMGHSQQDQDAQQSHPFFQGTRRKVCTECQFAPPLRSHHCRICNRCVATFDHHCKFIGTCIGERNHCRFWWFLTWQAFAFTELTSIVASSSSFSFFKLLRMLLMTAGDQQVDEGWWIIIIAKLYLYPLWLFAWLMWIVHTIFAITNMTTFECGKGPKHIDYLKGTHGTDFPFSKGFLGNVRLFCCQRDACCSFIQRNNQKKKKTTNETASSVVAGWKPIVWKTPGKIIRDSEDWWEHPWQNKYWSCC